MAFLRPFSIFLIFNCYFLNNFVNAYYENDDAYYGQKSKFYNLFYKIRSSEEGYQIHIQNLSPYKLTHEVKYLNNIDLYSVPEIKLGQIETMKFQESDYKISSNFFVVLRDEKNSPRFFIHYERPEGSNESIIRFYSMEFKPENPENFLILFDKESGTLTLTFPFEKKKFDKKFEIKSHYNECLIHLKNLTPHQLYCHVEKTEYIKEEINEIEQNLYLNEKIRFSFSDSYLEYILDSYSESILNEDPSIFYQDESILNQDAILDLTCNIDTEKYKTLIFSFEISMQTKKCHLTLESDEDYKKQTEIVYNEEIKTLALIPKRIDLN